LESFGVETAADVTWANVMSIPGFGPALTDRVMKWRLKLENGFQFNQNAPLDPRDVALVEQKIARMRQELQRQLAIGPRELREAARGTDLRRRSLVERARKVAAGLAQSSAELRNSPMQFDFERQVEEERKAARAKLQRDGAVLRQVMRDM